MWTVLKACSRGGAYDCDDRALVCRAPRARNEWPAGDNGRGSLGVLPWRRREGPRLAEDRTDGARAGALGTAPLRNQHTDEALDRIHGLPQVFLAATFLTLVFFAAVVSFAALFFVAPFAGSVKA